jgi:hypothetical protein
MTKKMEDYFKDAPASMTLAGERVRWARAKMAEDAKAEQEDANANRPA